MIYVIVKMSSKWYVIEYSDVEEAGKNIQDHVDQGSIVVVCDDYEYFIDLVGLDPDDFEIVEQQ